MATSKIKKGDQVIVIAGKNKGSQGKVKSVKNGILADVAPTVLDLMGLAKPAEMTGESLVEL